VPDASRPSEPEPTVRGLAIIAVVCLSCLSSGRFWLRHQDLSHARSATGLPISELAHVDVCDDHDIAIGYHLRAGEELADAVMAERRDLVYPLPDRPIDSLFVTADCLPRPDDGARSIYAAGCGRGQSWIAMLDPQTRDLWLEVRSYDAGWDRALCPARTAR